MIHKISWLSRPRIRWMIPIRLPISRRIRFPAWWHGNPVSITLNFSSTTIVRFETNSLPTDAFSHQVHLRGITLVDFSLLNSSLIKTNLNLHFTHVRYVKWFEIRDRNPTIQFHFDAISNGSCLIYHAPRSISWLFPNSTICNCPLLFAYKHGQLDGQIIPCIRTMSGYESARRMDECQFERRENTCHSTVQSLTDFDNHTISPSNSLEIDHFLIRQLYDDNYLTCSYNYTLIPFVSHRSFPFILTI